MLNFICSTSETAKTSEIYRRAQADAQKGTSVFILVPEQYSMYTEKELLTVLGLSAQNKIRVLTFSKLCNLIFSKLGPLRTNYMDKAGKYIMTRRALALSAENLVYFRRNLNQHGFTGLIRTAVSEFKRYGISPSELRQTAEKTDNEKLRLKLLDLAEIYEKFNSLVEENHANTEDNLSLAVPRISKADFLRGSFYLNFFRSFTPTEYAVISELMTVADVTVALTADSIQGSSGVFSSQIYTHQKLTEAAKEKGIAFHDPVFLTHKDTSATDLIHLKENFFSFSPKVFNEKPEHIHILRPDNFHAEVTSCAGLIRRLLREEGYSLNDFLILTGSMENYEFLIPQIFTEYGITYFLDRKLPLTENPLMRMIISVLEILTYGFSYDRIMRLARSGYLPVSTEETDIFENYILAADISHSRWNSRDDWSFNPDRDQFDMDFINSVKKKLIHPILDLADMFHGRKTAKIICDNLCIWLDKMNTQALVNQKIQNFKSSSDHEKAEELRMVWNSFVSVCGRICECMEQDRLTFAEFYDLFTASCGEISVGMVPPTQDKVMISPVDMFRSTGSKVTIVLGALDGTFPRDYKTEGLISDAERQLLQASGLTLAPDTFSLQKEEQFLIYSVLTTPADRLYVYAPLSDRDGKGLKPSEILHTLKSIFPQLEESSDKSRAEISAVESREAAFQGLSVQLFRKDWKIELLSPLWQTVYDYLENDAEYAPRISRLHKMYLSKFSSTALTPEMAKQLYGLPLTLSVSKLEKYNACAFSFFMQYGLLAQERLLGGLKSTDTGNILHSVLCDYFKTKADANADYSEIQREQCYAEISALVDRAGQSTNENLFSDSHYYKYMMLRMKNIATATAWKLIRFYAQSSFRPAGFEISFGKNATYPPYELNTTRGKVCLKGFIDRVDSAEIDGTTYLSITDYKSSERQLDLPLAEAGIHFQPMIYANALSRHLSGSKVAAMFYLQMNDPMLAYTNPPSDERWESDMSDKIAAHGIILNDADIIRSIDQNHGDKDAIHYIKCTPSSLLEKNVFECTLTSADKKAAESADNILSGKIEASPNRISGFDPCQYCPYESICSSK